MRSEAHAIVCYQEQISGGICCSDIPSLGVSPSTGASNLRKHLNDGAGDRVRLACPNEVVAPRRRGGPPHNGAARPLNRRLICGRFTYEDTRLLLSPSSICSRSL